MVQAVGDDPRRLVAKLTGFNHETVRRYLHGQGDPPASFLKALCEAYHVSADWLLLGDLGGDRWKTAEAGLALDRAADAIHEAKQALRARR